MRTRMRKAGNWVPQGSWGRLRFLESLSILWSAFSLSSPTGHMAFSFSEFECCQYTFISLIWLSLHNIYIIDYILYIIYILYVYVKFVKILIFMNLPMLTFHRRLNKRYHKHKINSKMFPNLDFEVWLKILLYFPWILDVVISARCFPLGIL